MELSVRNLACESQRVKAEELDESVPRVSLEGCAREHLAKTIVKALPLNQSSTIVPFLDKARRKHTRIRLKNIYHQNAST